MEQQALFASQYEDEFLLRTLGPLAYRSDIALSELVANAWDAGATKVDITVPAQLGGKLIVEDDGTGLTREQFVARWMKLAYNRLKRQGEMVEFPPNRQHLSRLAYGRNGVGRHGLLCFSDIYEVTTRREGQRHDFVVSTSSGAAPFVMRSDKVSKARGHGTRLTVKVARHLPDADELANVLSARFLHDPAFKVMVNGKVIPLEDHVGVVDQVKLTSETGHEVEVFLIDTTRSSRRTRYNGIAFWVGGRLVGVPSWSLAGQVILDGRTKPAKRFTAIARCDSLRAWVRPDWSGFLDAPEVESVAAAVGEYVVSALKSHSQVQVDEVAIDALQAAKAQLEKLPSGARIEVAEFAQHIVAEHPTIGPNILSTAVRAVIQLENSRSGQALLEKLSILPDGDIDALDRLLGEWSVRDALTVLDEIDSRLSVIAALERLSEDKNVDELHTLHPLVVKARWLFGPHFDSPEYVSNRAILTAVREIFDAEASAADFINPRRRADLIVRADATVYAAGVERIDSNSPHGLVKLDDVLLIELKRGGFSIGREEMHQASNYVEDLLRSGHLHGSPVIHAFVVGHVVDQRIEPRRTIGEHNRGRIEAVSYNVLVSTASRRLFRLREQLPERYEELSGQALLTRALGAVSAQSSLFSEGK